MSRGKDRGAQRNKRKIEIAMRNFDILVTIQHLQKTFYQYIILGKTARFQQQIL